MSQAGVVTQIKIADLAPALVPQVAPGLGRSLGLFAQSTNFETKAIFRISTAGIVAPSYQVPKGHPLAFEQFLAAADGSLWFTNVTGKACLLGQISAPRHGHGP